MDDNNKDRTSSLHNIALIIAHPDDEAMFFTPTLTSLKNCNIYLLCLSTGDADGLGQTRKKELEKSCDFFGIKGLEIVDDPSIRDGMKEKWDETIIENYVEDFMHKNRINEVCI